MKNTKGARTSKSEESTQKNRDPESAQVCSRHWTRAERSGCVFPFLIQKLSSTDNHLQIYLRYFIINATPLMDQNYS